MSLSSGGFHVKVTLIDEMGKVFDPLTGLKGTEEMTDKLTDFTALIH